MSQYELFIDTSNRFFIFLLSKDKKIIFSHSLLAPRMQSEIFIPTLKKYFQKFNISLKEVQHLYIVNGPRSFIGIKITLTFKKMLGVLNKKLRIFTISSLLFQAGVKNIISVLEASKINS